MVRTRGRPCCAAIILGALGVLGTMAGCGGGGGAVDAGGERAPTGMCGADIPAGEACHALVDPRETVVPTCATGTMPAGQGGPIFDGTYVLTAQTFYNRPVCPTISLSQIIQVAGDCLQTASGIFGTAAARLTIDGNSLTTTRTCVHVDSDAATSMAGPSIQTFTATATTFTLFTDYIVASEPGIDNVAVYTKR